MRIKRHNIVHGIVGIKIQDFDGNKVLSAHCGVTLKLNASNQYRTTKDPISCLLCLSAT